MSKPISQREARRLRKNLMHLQEENAELRRSADQILERHEVARFPNIDPALRRDVFAIKALGFRAEVSLSFDGNVLLLFGVRRMPI